MPDSNPWLIDLQERRRDEQRAREETRRRESEAVLSAVQHEMERPRNAANDSVVKNGKNSHKNQSESQFL